MLKFIIYITIGVMISSTVYEVLYEIFGTPSILKSLSITFEGISMWLDSMMNSRS
jgi:hypothetical protein